MLISSDDSILLIGSPFSYVCAIRDYFQDSLQINEIFFMFHLHIFWISLQ